VFNRISVVYLVTQRARDGFHEEWQSSALMWWVTHTHHWYDDTHASAPMWWVTTSIWFDEWHVNQHWRDELPTLNTDEWHTLISDLMTHMHQHQCDEWQPAFDLMSDMLISTDVMSYPHLTLMSDTHSSVLMWQKLKRNVVTHSSALIIQSWKMEIYW